MRQQVDKLINEEYGCIAVKFLGKTFTKDQQNKGVIGFSDEKYKKCSFII